MSDLAKKLIEDFQAALSVDYNNEYEIRRCRKALEDFIKLLERNQKP